MSLNAKLPPFLVWLGASMLLLAYILPWVVNPGAALTLGGYDLAEWISLHPGARAQTPMLFTSLLLRLPLVSLTWLIATHSSSRLTWNWWLSGVIAGLLVVAQLPPLEFVANPNDPNYQQQMALAGLSLVGVILGLSGILVKWHLPIMLVSIIVGSISSVWGMSFAVGMMRDFRLTAETGVGVALFVGVTVVWSSLIMGWQWQANRAA
jgi:hypothetical protein